MMEQEIDPPERPSIGHLFRQRRESMGLSIDDVVAKIKLARRQIVALEEDNYQALPEIAFLRGFVRSYARLLQMDENALLSKLPEAPVTEVRTEPPENETPFPTKKSAMQQSIHLLVAALLVALAIIGFTLWQKTDHHPAKQQSVVSTPLQLPEQQAASEGGAASAPSAIEPNQSDEAAPDEVEKENAASEVKAEAQTNASSSLRLVFDKECWVKIKDKNGNTLSKQVNQAGTELNIDGEAPFSLVIGHATAVHLFYRGKPVDLGSYVNASSDVAHLTLK
jgi:cytoskeleton protein RodZ